MSDYDGDHSHLRVRPNGVIYTTAEELLNDPKVREDIRRTGEVIEAAIERRERSQQDSPQDEDDR